MKFSEYLTYLRQRANLTNRQLAEKAGVPRSLIAGLQSGQRRVGEYNGRMIGEALGLTGLELEHFIYQAVDTCTEKVLKDSQQYPAELLNLLAKQLRAVGVLPEHIDQYRVQGDSQASTVALTLKDGAEARIATTVAHS
jgi:transcriptional regulator with XRE-family HTH domain